MSPDIESAGLVDDNLPKALGPMTSLMIDHLRATKPWARLVAVVGFVGSGLMVLAGLAFPFVSALSGGPGGAVGGVAMGFAYLFLGCLYFFPCLFLFRYATAIQKLLVARDSDSMEAALSHQKSFWRIVGIATLVLLGFYVVALAVIALVAIAQR